MQSCHDLPGRLLLTLAWQVRHETTRRRYAPAGDPRPAGHRAGLSLDAGLSCR